MLRNAQESQGEVLLRPSRSASQQRYEKKYKAVKHGQLDKTFSTGPVKSENVYTSSFFDD